MSILAVADTHALIWFAGSRWNKLGRRARAVFERVLQGDGAIFVPALALVELSEAVHAGEIKLSGGFAAWCRQIFASGQFIPADLTWPVVQRAEQLFAIPERGDRLIAATAVELGYPLITRDPEIASVAGLELIW